MYYYYHYYYVYELVILFYDATTIWRVALDCKKFFLVHEGSLHLAQSSLSQENKMHTLLSSKCSSQS